MVHLSIDVLISSAGVSLYRMEDTHCRSYRSTTSWSAKLREACDIERLVQKVQVEKSSAFASFYTLLTSSFGFLIDETIMLTECSLNVKPKAYS